MSRDENELINKIYSVQQLQTTKGDWFETIQKIKEICEIEKTDEEIKSMKKDLFKTYVKKNFKKVGHEFLQALATIHSKSQFTLKQKKLEQKKYLSDERFSKNDAQLLFTLRSRMLPVKSNFKKLHNNNLQCQTCDKSLIEDENHILICENLKNEESVKIKFEEDFGPVDLQLNAAKVFKNVLRKRDSILELKNNT